jgi:excisionase family DNA binding protein
MNKKTINLILESLVEKAVDAKFTKITQQVELNNKESPPLTMPDVVKLTNLAKPTLYRLVQQNEIPHYRRAKIIYFDREEILNWLKGRKTRRSWT